MKPLIAAIICIKLALGLMLLLGIHIRMAAISCSAIVLFSVMHLAPDITAAYRNTDVINGCDCFSRWLLIGSDDPYIGLFINVISFCLGLFIAMCPLEKRRYELKTGLKKRICRHSFLLVGIAIISIIVLIIPRIKADGRAIAAIRNNREQVMMSCKATIPNELDSTIFRDIRTGDLIDIRQFIPNHYIVLLIIRSLDCPDCIREMRFVDTLHRKYRNIISFYGIVGNISDIAIHNILSQYSFGFRIVQDINSIIIPKLSDSVLSLKLLLSNDGTVIDINPSSYGVRAFQREYESLIKKIRKEVIKRGRR